MKHVLLFGRVTPLELRLAALPIYTHVKKQLSWNN